jgi:hypothetical protein
MSDWADPSLPNVARSRAPPNGPDRPPQMVQTDPPCGPDRRSTWAIPMLQMGHTDAPQVGLEAGPVGGGRWGRGRWGTGRGRRIRAAVFTRSEQPGPDWVRGGDDSPPRPRSRTSMGAWPVIPVRSVVFDRGFCRLPRLDPWGTGRDARPCSLGVNSGGAVGRSAASGSRGPRRGRLRRGTGPLGPPRVQSGAP